MDVRILGPLEVYGPDGPIDLGLRKARLLFAALALRGGSPIANDALAEALWPNRLPDAWEATLHAHVSRLRRALDPQRKRRDASRIETRGTAYALRVDDDEVDARRFEKLSAAGRAALARGDATQAAALLTQALDEWRGPVLVDFSDEPFIEIEARRLDESRLIAVVQRIEAELHLGHDAAVIAELEVLVELHALREDIWELLLIALYRTGRQAEALRRYAQVREILVEELGIEPGPTLRDLEGAILRQDVDLGRSQSVITNVPSTPTRELPAWFDVPRDSFVGRDVPLATIVDAWHATASGDRRALVLVEGEPGIGKTQLAREAARALHADGAAVVGGRCVEEALHAFQPFAEVVDGIGAPDDALALDSDPARIVLSSIAADPDAAVASMPIHDDEAMQYALFRALSATLTRARLGAPPVLVLDDVQWASTAALQVLAHVLRDDQRGRLLVIVTARDTEANPALDGLVADLQRDQRLHRIALQNLTADDVSHLVDARASGADTDDVFRLTEGNPFYVEQMLRHVAESGGALDQSTVPDSVRDTVARRLLRLSDETRRLLGIAAVVGQEFSLSVLAHVGGCSVETADDLLTGALSARVVTERTGRVGSYAFTHGLIRNVLRDGLGAARVARVHRSVAIALEHTPSVETVAADIAFHHLAAAADGSDPFVGVEWARRAAARARAHFAFSDAASLLASAVQTLDQTEHAFAAPILCETLLELSVAQRCAGREPERAASLERAYMVGAECAVELRALIVVEAYEGSTVLADAWRERAEALQPDLDPANDVGVVITALLAFAATSVPGTRARDLALSVKERRHALAPRARSQALQLSTMALHAWQSPADFVADSVAAVDAAREGRDATQLTSALSALRQAYLTSGEVDRSDVLAREYEELVRELRIPWFQAGVEQNRATRALLAGRFAEAEAHAEQAVVLQPTQEYLEGLAVQLFAIRFEQGRLDEVRGAVSEWAALDTRPAWRLGQAMLEAELGELELARAGVDPWIASEFATVPHDQLWFASLACAAHTAALLGDEQAAQVTYEFLAPEAERVIVLGEATVCWGSVHRLLAPLAVVLGQRAQAVAHYEQAAQVHERLGALPFLARDRLGLARTLADSERPTDHVRAEELARTGLAMARELGMASVLARNADLAQPKR